MLTTCLVNNNMKDTECELCKLLLSSSQVPLPENNRITTLEDLVSEMIYEQRDLLTRMSLSSGDSLARRKPENMPVPARYSKVLLERACSRSVRSCWDSGAAVGREAKRRDICSGGIRGDEIQAVNWTYIYNKFKALVVVKVGARTEASCVLKGVENECEKKERLIAIVPLFFDSAQHLHSDLIIWM
jgi:hypothetical protein